MRWRERQPHTPGRGGSREITKKVIDAFRSSCFICCSTACTRGASPFFHSTLIDRVGSRSGFICAMYMSTHDIQQQKVATAHNTRTRSTWLFAQSGALSAPIAPMMIKMRVPRKRPMMRRVVMLRFFDDTQDWGKSTRSCSCASPTLDARVREERGRDDSRCSSAVAQVKEWEERRREGECENSINGARDLFFSAFPCLFPSLLSGGTHTHTHTTEEKESAMKERACVKPVRQSVWVIRLSGRGTGNYEKMARKG